MKISDLIFDEHNANCGTERGQALLETSLQKYGAGRSILIDKNKRIISGNKTVEMAGQIGIEDVIIVPSDGKKIIAVQRNDLDLETDKEARELAYADNRVGELDLSWNFERIQEDMDLLDIKNMFNEFDIKALSDKLEKTKELAEKQEQEEEEEEEEKGFCDLNDWLFFPSSNKWGIPDLLSNSEIELPEALVEYREPLPEDNIKRAVSFFTQDYRFRSVWTQAKTTIGRIKKVGIALSPDFSIYGNYPLPLRLYNVYRNRWCGRWFQENGVNVIPTVTWSYIEEDYEFVFSGIPKGSIIAFSIVGAHNKEEKHWKEEENAVKRLMETIEPAKVIIYGEAWNKFKRVLSIIPEDKQIRFNSRWKEKKDNG